MHRYPYQQQAGYETPSSYTEQHTPQYVEEETGEAARFFPGSPFPGQVPGGFQPGFPGQGGPPGGQPPGFPGGPGGPGGPSPGGFPPPFSGGPQQGGQQGGPPSTPPPNFTPQQPAFQTFAVDPGAIRNCLFRFTYVWLHNGRSFWFYPVFIGRTSIAGFRWSRNRWTYLGIDLRSIQSLQCF